MHETPVRAVFKNRHQVTLLARGPRLLPYEDDDIAEAVTGLLTAHGVDIRTDSPVASVRSDGDQRVVTLTDGTDVTGDEVLVAVGRRPVTAELDLDAGGVRTTDASFVAVDEHLATDVPHTWAAGDVAGAGSSPMSPWSTTGSSRPTSPGAPGRPGAASSRTPPSSQSISRG
ncbi:FAD-dependent oxidoreductase [Streptomyces sp. NPDC002206]